MKVRIRNLPRRLPIKPSHVRQAVRLAAGERFAAPALDLIFLDDPAIRELNRRFLGRDRATDVIAFDYTHDPLGSSDEPDPAGEVFISVDRAIAEARRRRLPLQRELLLYVVHGVLHLVGYDDRRAADARRMRREQLRLIRHLRPLWEEKRRRA